MNFTELMDKLEDARKSYVEICTDKNRIHDGDNLVREAFEMAGVPCTSSLSGKRIFSLRAKELYAIGNFNVLSEKGLVPKKIKGISSNHYISVISNVITETPNCSRFVTLAVEITES